jgi:hypothetical protein
LKNPFCKFKLHFDIDFNKKQNIISCSFFKISKPYKKLSVYVDGIKAVIKYVEDNFTDVKIRLFVDKTIMDDENIKKILLSNEIVQVVEYGCYRYLEADKYHHKGTFGTIVRLFPMFDFENNDANHVMVWDIDLTLDDMKQLKIVYDYIIEENINYHLIYFGYKSQQTPTIKYDYQIPQAGRMINSKRFPHMKK